MKKNLTDYHFPEDLKEMSQEELSLLSYSIRDFLIQNVSKTGGHLASNLGVVELSIGLHKVFDSPKDKIIWDVGHQSYVHKILTGRAQDFPTLRQSNGMSGFPKACESEHDVYDTGHSSTSLSAAAGMAAARDIQKEDYDVIAVIGDGSLTGGMAYEALNNIGASKSKVIIILNDNGMSISKNIGGVSDHLQRLRTSSRYLSAKKSVENTIKKIPRVGDGIASGLSEAKDWIKYAIMEEGVMFEELGFKYYGPIDGHNLDEVIEMLQQSKEVNRPVILHMITQKGKGYRNAELHPNTFHGIGPFDIETGKPLSQGGTSYSKVMGDTLCQLASENEKICGITAAMGTATGLLPFSEKFPDRYFDVGIAEAHGVTFAAGLAKCGMHPLVAIYSSFLQRGYDQLIEDICLQNLPVVFAIDRAGIVGADGETHHGIFDLSYLSQMPNMTVLTPSNGNELAEMMAYAFTCDHPVAIRYPRGACLYDIKQTSGETSEWNKRLFTGKDCDIYAVGAMRAQAEVARALLKERGIDAGLVQIGCVKPLPTEEVEPGASVIFTIEDNTYTGGFGMQFAAAMSGKKPVVSIAWPDQFIEHGAPADLYQSYGLDAAGLVERICEYFEGKA